MALRIIEAPKRPLAAGKLRLNIGCGNNHLDGYVNIDSQAKCHPDFKYDVEQIPWPWESDSCEEINMTHVLEHLGQDPKVFIAIVCEVHRVLCVGGVWKISVPHPRSDAFTGDPTHVRPITDRMMAMWSKKICRDTQAKGWANTPFALYYDVDFEVVTSEHKLLDPWWPRLCKARDDNNQAEIEYVTRAMEERWNVIGELLMTLRKTGD